MPVAGGVVSVRGAVAFFSGDWGTARSCMAQFAALNERAGRTWVVPYVLIDQGRLDPAEGRTDQARRRLEEALREAERIYDVQGMRYAAALLATCDLREGRPAAARDRLVPLRDWPELREPDVTALLPILAQAYLDLGDTTKAAMVAADAVARAYAIDYRVILVDAFHVQARVYMSAGTWDAARSVIAEGLTLARRLPYPYGEARLLEDDGSLHVGVAEPDLARAQLVAAATIYTRLGARFDRDRIDHEIAGLP